MIRYNRQSTRLRTHDYSSAGAYFITVCTHNRENLFGQIKDGMMYPNSLGIIVRDIWLGIPSRYRNIHLDEFVLMPDHVHGIILIPTMGAASSAPTLGNILRYFKSLTAITINKHIQHSYCPVWQRGYWDRIIRNDEDMYTIQEYIRNNPYDWQSP